MRDGFIRVAALTPAVRVADVEHNVVACAEAVRSVTGAQVIVLPELAITSYTCEDLFWQDALLRAAEEGLARFAELTADVDALVFVGVPCAWPPSSTTAPRCCAPVSCWASCPSATSPPMASSTRAGASRPAPRT